MKRPRRNHHLLLHQPAPLDFSLELSYYHWPALAYGPISAR
jgi:hypothetical protein